MNKYLYSKNDQVLLYKGNNVDVLKTLPEESINCVVTSPPYYGLRDYGSATWIGGDANCDHKSLVAKRGMNSTGGDVNQTTSNEGMGVDFYTTCPMCNARKQDEQIGLEATPKEYVENMVQVFREVKRVLAKDGTLWLNLGDSYAGSNGNGYKQTVASQNSSNAGGVNESFRDKFKRQDDGYKPKDLMGIPWKVAFALQDDGWYLRQDIIWHKPAPMPESVKDRCTKSHEYIFLLSKSKNYYYDADAIKESSVDNESYSFRNKRSVWSINTASYKDSHFAVFPKELPMNCIKAGTREGDVVLDPFAGSGTTLMVAQELGRKAIGIDVKSEYLDMCLERTKQMGLF